MATIVYFNNAVRIGFPLPDGQAWTHRYVLENPAIASREQIIGSRNTVEFTITEDTYISGEWAGLAIAVTDEDDRTVPSKFNPENQLVLMLKQSDGTWKDSNGSGIYIGTDAQYSGLGFNANDIGKRAMIRIDTKNQIGVAVHLGHIEEFQG